ncbi:MAG: lipolytic enzyme, G-D-S-L [Oscillospiraceae bacterium]|nr:lipolytic enzyme, G-D-S-L [Oscillospiraceae bacterium]
MKKHIVCFGDSNTHGYCADPSDCADGGDRYNEEERWTCLLQKQLGEDYLVIEEGLSGRTTVFDDPITESLSGLDAITSCLMSHEPVDLLIIMLGTNDTKERFGVTPALIAAGLDRLVAKAQSVPAWGGKTPRILLLCPPHIGEGLYLRPEGGIMGSGCPEKSRELAPFYAETAKARNCAFLDVEGLAEFNRLDCMHLTRRGHSQLAARLAELVPGLLR